MRLKNVLVLLPLALVLFCLPIHAQAHSVALAWTASPDGGTVNVYRMAGACPASATTGTGTKLTATPLAAGVASFSDTTVTVGAFCYYVTDVLAGAESVPSNLVPAVILPSPPTALHTTSTS